MHAPIYNCTSQDPNTATWWNVPADLHVWTQNDRAWYVRSWSQIFTCWSNTVRTWIRCPSSVFYSRTLVGQHGIWTKASLPHVKTLICVLFVRILSCSISYVADTQTKRYMKEMSIIKEVEKRERQGNKKKRNDVFSPQTVTFVKIFHVVTNRLWSHNIRKENMISRPHSSMPEH